MLSKDEFLPFAQKVVPFLHVTTHIKGRKNDDLFRKKTRFGGFPTLGFMDADGEMILILHPSQRSLQGFEEAFQQANRFASLRERAKSDPKAAKAFLILQMEMKKLGFEEASEVARGMDFEPQERLAFERALVETLLRMKPAEAKKALARLQLHKGPAARARQILQDLEIREELKPLRRMRPGSKQERPYSIAYGLFKKGRVPSGKPHFDTLYWTSVSQAAFQKKDVETLEAALDQLRAAFGKTNPKWVKGWEEKLRLLKQQNPAVSKKGPPSSNNPSNNPSKNSSENSSENTIKNSSKSTPQKN